MFKLFTAALCVLLTVSGVRADGQREPAAPRDVDFHSVNLRNTVRWSSGTGDAHGTTYTVEYAIYGDAVDVEGTEQVAWRPVEQCGNVTQTECDVTEQTDDMEEEYYARVRANGPNGRSEWTEIDRRLRLTDTTLGPPNVNVTVVENILHVKLSGPFRWRNPGKKRQSIFNIFPHMFYNVSVYNNSSKHTSFRQSKKLLQYGPLEYSSEHCVRAEVLSSALHLTTVPSDWICVSIADDPFKSQMLLLVLGGVVPTAICLFVLVAVGGFAYYYICGHKPRLPKSVDIQQDANMERKFLMFQPEKHLASINVIIINNTNLSTGETKRSFLDSCHRGVDVPERSPFAVVRDPTGAPYAVQNVRNTSAEAGEGLQSRRSTLSEDYGFVHQEDRSQVASCPYNPQVALGVGGDNLYMVQTGQTKPAQERYEDEEEEEEVSEIQTFCNWDPDTGRLHLDFPALSRFDSEPPETTDTQTSVDTALLVRYPVLTSVVLKQASMESRDDDPLLQMEKDWDLQVQSTAE